MLSGNATSPSATGQAHESVETVVEGMKKMSMMELFKLLNTLVEQMESAKFKMGYALSIIDQSPLKRARMIEELPSPVKRYIVEQKVNSPRLVNSGIPWNELAGISWSRLNHIAGFVGVENLNEVIPLARKDTFGEFVKNTDLPRRLALAVRAARNRVLRDEAKKRELAA
jgi:hypothetical protein